MRAQDHRVLLSVLLELRRVIVAEREGRGPSGKHSSCFLLTTTTTHHQRTVTAGPPLSRLLVMSRHRAVRNLDLDEELAENSAYDYQEDPYEDITDKESADLENALARVIDVLGPAQTSGFKDREIKDALWDSYFDVESTTAHFLDEQGKRQARALKKQEAAERKRAAAASSSPNPASRIGSGAATPVRSSSAARTPAKTTASSGKLEAGPVSQLRSDIEGMGLSEIRGVQTDSKPGSAGSGTPKVPPKAALSNEKVIEEWEKQQKTGKPALSLIVVGHVDAGKSTLMGKLLHELGRVSDREQSSNERASARIGKGSFAYAWNLDSSEEEHARGVTIDIAQDSFSTAHRQFTLLDAPGHRDFIPNMISGSAQADAAILVIDAALGAFEAGFGPNGQTREHALLLRSLGVQQLVVVVNKLDAVDWNQGRFEEIAEQLKPFLTKSGFDVGKIQFIPCGAAIGENLGARSADGALSSWYSGPVLVDVLDTLEPPSRQLKAPLRMPLTNVFKGQTAVASGIGAAGRLLSGVVQVGDRLRVLPGDETAAIRAIEVDEEQVPWAVAGTNATLYLASIDQAQVNIGSVLCTPGAEVPICSVFIAQILVFEPSYPLVAGSQVELFHHSANVPATLTELISITDKISGQPTNKRKPRVLGRGVTAQVRITVQAGGAAGQSRGIPVEDFKTNKEMARILLRREGETVAAGIIAELVSTS